VLAVAPFLSMSANMTMTRMVNIMRLKINEFVLFSNLVNIERMFSLGLIRVSRRAHT
jgi:hypothetical protein